MGEGGGLARKVATTVYAVTVKIWDSRSTGQGMVAFETASRGEWWATWRRGVHARLLLKACMGRRRVSTPTWGHPLPIGVRVVF